MPPSLDVSPPTARDVSFEAVKKAIKGHHGEQLKARLAAELRQKATVHVKPPE